MIPPFSSPTPLATFLTAGKAIAVHYNARQYNLKFDAQKVTDGAMTSGSAILTSATGLFNATDVGKYIQVQGAGSGPGVLTTTILSYQSATQVTLAANSLSTISSKEAYWATDDNAAAAALFDTMIAAGGGYLDLPFGGSIFSAAVVKTLSNARIIVSGSTLGSEIRVGSNTQSSSGGLFDITGAAAVGVDYIAFRDLTITGNTTGGMGLRFTDTFNGDLTNIRGKDFRSSSGWGVAINMGSQAIAFTIFNPILTGCLYAGIQFGSACNKNNIFGGWIYQNNLGGAGVRVSSANGNTFWGTVIEGNTYGAICTGGRNNNFNACWFESNVNDGVRLGDLVNQVENSWFTGNGTDIRCLSGGTDAYITKNDFNDGGKITLDSGAIRPHIYKNSNLTTVTDNTSGTIVKIDDNPGFTRNRLALDASTTSAASLNIPSGTAPTSPGDGDTWYDGTHLKFRIGSTTYQLDQQLAAGGAMTGTTTNDNATSGIVGEIISSVIASGSATSLTSATPKNVTSISLTAGDWDITGIIDYVLTGATTSDFKSGSSSTSATFGAQDSFANLPIITTLLSDTVGHMIPTTRFSLASTTTVYLVAQCNFSAGTTAAYGTIRARRMR